MGGSSPCRNREQKELKAVDNTIGTIPLQMVYRLHLEGPLSYSSLLQKISPARRVAHPLVALLPAPAGMLEAGEAAVSPATSWH